MALFVQPCSTCDSTLAKNKESAASRLDCWEGQLQARGLNRTTTTCKDQGSPVGLTRHMAVWAHAFTPFEKAYAHLVALVLVSLACVRSQQNSPADCLSDGQAFRGAPQAPPPAPPRPLDLDHMTWGTSPQLEPRFSHGTACLHGLEPS